MNGRTTCSTSGSLLAVGLLLLLPGAASAQPAARMGHGGEPYGAWANEMDDASPAPAAGEMRAREGAELIDRQGRFRQAGDRLTFYSDDGSVRLVCLENLSLERVARALAENPDDLSWTVSGLVTEYRGSNYLLVRRAVLNRRVGEDSKGPGSR
jgi:hypothetical protein